MAASTTHLSFPVESQDKAEPVGGSRCHRRISPQAGHALEMLGHAIEYLTDEYVHEGRSLSSGDAQVKAVRLLMALNREIYLECPKVPSVGDRIREFFHGVTA
jgi:hypothetical protein